MPRKAAATFFLAVVLAGPLSAASREELEQVQQDVQASRARQEKLAEEQGKIENELGGLQRRLVESASSTQKAETDMAAAQEKLRIFNEQLHLKHAALEEQRGKLAALVQAALHLSRMPPEAMVMMPGDKNTMKAARALKMTSDGIRAEMDSIRLQTSELNRLQQKTAARRNELTEKQAALAKEKEELQEKLAARQALQEKLGRRQKEEEERTAELARKAENMQTLLTSISRKERAPDPGRGARKGKGRSFADAKGRLRLPVSGRLAQRFGGAQKQAETAKGIVIAAGASGAQVVAPFDGEVVFAGPFLNYGKLVILKHSDDFHTLLAGLGTIEAGVGEFLLEGEPIGAMGNSDAGRRLYVELRKDNQPVNPEPWIKDLNNKKR